MPVIEGVWTAHADQTTGRTVFQRGANDKKQVCKPIFPQASLLGLVASASREAMSTTLATTTSASRSAPSATCTMQYTEASPNGMEATQGHLVISKNGASVYEQTIDASPGHDVSQKYLDVNALSRETHLSHDLRVTSTSPTDKKAEMNPVYVVYGSMSVNSAAKEYKDGSKVPHCSVTEFSTLSSGAVNNHRAECVFMCE